MKASTRILIVDDDSAISTLLQHLLEQQHYKVATAASAEEARVAVEATDFELVICDVDLGGSSGIHLMKMILRQKPDTAVVMLTGMDDTQLAHTALSIGAYGYMIKPFKPNELLINVVNALRRRDLEIDNRRHRMRLEGMVEQRTADLQEAVLQLEKTEDELKSSREETIQRLARAAEWRDDETAQHIQRMSLYSELVARKAGQSRSQCELIRIASPMHDIGKIGTPDHILFKPDPLTCEEFEIMKRHSIIGFRILTGSSSALLNLAASIALTHHEWYDGSGYPKGLRGNSIPFEGRITAITDVFDALSSSRIYKHAYPIERSLQLMKSGRESHFDPELLDLFLDSIDEILEIRKRNTES